AAEVEEIEKRLRHGPTEPIMDSQGTWHPIDRAMEFKNARQGLLYLHKNKPCPQLGGDILHAKRFRRMVPQTHRKSMVWTWLQADLERLSPPQPGGRRNRTEAYEKPTPERTKLAGTWQSTDGERPQPTSNKGKQADSTGSRVGEASSSRAPKTSRS